jgi:hypothetical protein
VAPRNPALGTKQLLDADAVAGIGADPAAISVVVRHPAWSKKTRNRHDRGAFPGAPVRAFIRIYARKIS